MANYVGADCPVCDERFTTSDDIVVCPICGAPHHRHCYMEKNRCAFEDEHIKGMEWKRPVREEAGSQATVACRRCGSQNPEKNTVCQVCGVQLGQEQQEYRWKEAASASREQWANRNPYNVDVNLLLYGGFAPDEKIAGESVCDIADYVGNNSAYFLPHFKILERGGYAFSVNLGALVFNFFYFFYRKMYKIGILMLALFLLSQTPTFLYMVDCWPHVMKEMARQNDFLYQQMLAMGFRIPTQEVDMALVQFYQSLMDIAHIAMFVVGVALSMFANYFYFKKAIAEVGAIRMRSEQNPMGPPRSARLQISGGAGIGAPIAVAAGLFLLSMLVGWVVSAQIMVMFPS